MGVRGWDTPWNPTEPPGSRGRVLGSLTVIVVGSLPALLVVALSHGAGQRCGGLLWCGWGWPNDLGCLWGPLFLRRVNVSYGVFMPLLGSPLLHGVPTSLKGFLYLHEIPTLPWAPPCPFGILSVPMGSSTAPIGSLCPCRNLRIPMGSL